MKYILYNLYISCLFVTLALPNLLLSQPRGSALSFDGTDGYVQVPHDPSLDMTSGFTIAAWIYIEEYTEWASIVTKGGVEIDGGALTPNNYTIHQSGPAGGSDFGHLRFTGSSPALPLYLESNTQIPLNEWHFVAITYDGTTLHFYFDGLADGGGLLPGPLDPNDDPLHIGVDFPGSDEYWYGLIDEVRIWNKSLKSTHIRAAMHGHSSPLGSALVGYWRFDEGDGNVTGDRSRERNHGQLFNDVSWINPGAPLSKSGKLLNGELVQSIPDELMLMQNYPNPFNPSTSINYSIPIESYVILKVYDVLGNEVTTLVNEERPIGSYEIEFDASNLPSGIYFYRLQAGNFIETKKMILLK